MDNPPDLDPAFNIRQLLASELVTPATRVALTARLESEAIGSASVAPSFFDGAELATLVAVCTRLMPPATLPTPVEGATRIAARLAEGRGDGWRFDKLPPDAEAYRVGLRGLHESAQAAGARTFPSLTPAQQDLILAALALDLYRHQAGVNHPSVPP